MVRQHVLRKLAALVALCSPRHFFVRTPTRELILEFGHRLKSAPNYTFSELPSLRSTSRPLRLSSAALRSLCRIPRIVRNRRKDRISETIRATVVGCNQRSRRIFPTGEDPPDERGTRKDPALEFGPASAPFLNGENLRRSSVLSYVHEGFPVEAEGDPYSTVRSHKVYSAWREQDGSPPGP